MLAHNYYKGSKWESESCYGNIPLAID